VPTKQKIQTVAKLRASFEKSKSLIVTEFTGLSVAQMESLRNKLREVGAEYHVVKNRLAMIALEQAGLDPMKDHLVTMRGVAVGLVDPVSPAKVLTQFAKENDKLKVVAGQMDKNVLSPAQVIDLSNLPSREELLGRMLGSLQSPIQKVAYGLHQTVAKVAYALDAVARQKAEQEG
jgi:large subunit ribosomal protein L10